MIKKIFTTLSYVGTVIGSALVGSAIDDYGMSPDVLLKALESTQALLGFLSLVVAGGIQVLKSRMAAPVGKPEELKDTPENIGNFSKLKANQKTSGGLEYND